MDDDKLIKLVEAREVIYNRHHPDYKYQDRKEAAFIEIAEELGVPDHHYVMRRYVNLRDRFVRYKRFKETTGEVRYYIPTMDKMEFLNKHVFSRKKRRKDYVCESDDSASMDPLQLSTSMNEDADENTMDMPSQSPETVIPTKRVKRKSEISPSISDPTVQNKPTSSTSHLSSIDQELSEAMKCFQKVCKAREERQKNGALQGFRQMIISTISNMSAAKQTKAILRVTEAVMQIKMEPED